MISTGGGVRGCPSITAQNLVSGSPCSKYPTVHTSTMNVYNYALYCSSSLSIVLLVYVMGSARSDCTRSPVVHPTEIQTFICEQHAHAASRMVGYPLRAKASQVPQSRRHAQIAHWGSSNRLRGKHTKDAAPSEYAYLRKVYRPTDF